MTLPLALRLATATVALVLATSARAEPTPIAVNATPWAFALMPGDDKTETVSLRSAIRLSSDDPRFGGFSGLAVSPDGRTLLAISDQSWWLKGKLQYTDGKLSGFGDAVIAPLTGLDGRRPSGKRVQDAEALVALTAKGPDGPVAVAFERLPRVQRYEPGRDGLPGKASAIKMPRDVESGPENDELEAVGVLRTGATAGRFVAISEGNFTDDGIAVRGWVFGGKGKPFGFTVKVDGTYRVTDLAVLPDGDVLLLERSFAPPAYIPGMSLRLVRASDIASGAVIEPQPLFKAEVPRFMVDNMEGLAVWQPSPDETRLLVMSDDNYARERQSTILVEFDLDLPPR